MKTYILDIECMPNFFLATFKEFGKNKYKEFMIFPDDGINDFKDNGVEINALKANHKIITFNGINYDEPMLCCALNLRRDKEAAEICQELKRINDLIIVDQVRHWQLTNHNVKKLGKIADHIDIKESLPGVGVSLKLYGCRANFPKLQELPIDPSSTITKEQAEMLRLYCRNDVDLTEVLYRQIMPQIELREGLKKKYGDDMRSKSDAQCAEVIIKSYLEKADVAVVKDTRKVKPFTYEVPEWLHFETNDFNALLDQIRDITFALSDKGAVVMPKELNKAFDFDGAKYKFGIGGLHSQEKMQTVIPHSSELFGEFDVASMYPSIIIEQGLYPEKLTDKFLTVYSTIKEQRLEAKRTGDKVKNDTYKIVLNGSYGKFGSKYSFLYSPKLLIQTTITGQLSLLMLIEKMTLAGGKVMSANTDGVNVLYPKTIKKQIFDIKAEWEKLTTYELEYTPYKSAFSRDVNSYIAIKEDGSVKGKGLFAPPSLMKNPQTNVVTNAVIAYLAHNTPIDKTVRECTNIHDFVSVRTVRGGAVKDGEYVGKVCRWYYSTDTSTAIHYKTNNNKVPKSDNAIPLMDLPDKLPHDMDYQWYINEAEKIAYALDEI